MQNCRYRFRLLSRASLQALFGISLASQAQTASGQAPSPTEASPPQTPPPKEPDQARQSLEDELAQALATTSPAPEPVVAPLASTPSPLRLIDISFDLLGSAGGSSAREDELRNLQAGGHDPKNQGFTLQNVELTLAGVVDPYLRGDSHIVLSIDPDGETILELEEAYLTTLDLPFNLQAKAGQFFSSFGRLNPSHPHAWDFVDQPVVSSRFMGPDGLRGPGAQLSWLTPLPFFAEVVLSAQNARGETAPSFLSVAGESIAGRTLGGREVRGPADLLYLARLRTSFDPTDALTLLLGASALLGPNATGDDTTTRIYGADVTARFRPLLNDHGWPFVAWQSELMYRDYEAGPVEFDGGPVASATSLGDWGAYSQLVWGFSRPWALGARYDRAEGERHEWSLADAAYDSASDPQRDERQRFSLVLTYYPSEFSKLRLQYNYDRAEFLRASDAHATYLQFEILFGAHGAHQF